MPQMISNGIALMLQKPCKIQHTIDSPFTDHNNYSKFIKKEADLHVPKSQHCLIFIKHLQRNIHVHVTTSLLKIKHHSPYLVSSSKNTYIYMTK